MPSLAIAYQYVIDACNDPYIDYNRFDLRETITLGVNYVTYCDCSSLLSKALTVGGYFTNNPWFYTGNEDYYLTKAGWEQVDLYGEWRPGDILWKDGHTEMVYTGGQAGGVSMGAHTSSSYVPFDRHVCINSYPSTASGSGWTRLYRDPTQTVATFKWYQSNTVLDEYGPEMTGNAYMVYQFFSSIGFSYAAIAGLLGNMQAESGINPGRWQDGTGPGYGLVQWDPASKYRNWATSQGIDMNDDDQNGDGQCTYVNMGEQVGQWGPYNGYSYTWAEFAALDSWHEATLAFLWEFEKPSRPHTENRLIYAEYWYNIISTGAWGAGDPGNPGYRPDNVRAALINDLQRRLVIPGRH